MVDAWHWIRFGRELATLDLATAGGWSSWKPLAVVFTTPFSLFGDAAPVLWTVVARAGAFATIALVALLPLRLARSSSFRGVDSKAALAAGSAGAGLVALHIVGRNLMTSVSEPLVTALMLGSILLTLDRRYRPALALMLIAALGRPEALLLAGAGTLALWHKEPSLRLPAALGAIAVVLAWWLPDWLSTGDLGHISTINSSWKLRPDLPPELRQIAPAAKVALRNASIPGLALITGGLAVAAAAWRRGERNPGLIAAAGLALIASWFAMTLLGSPAAYRYLQPPTLILISLGGFAVIAAIAALSSGGEAQAGETAGVRRILTLAAALATIVIAAASIPAQFAADIRSTSRDEAATNALGAAITAAGGRQAILACGPIARNSEQDGLLSWKLNVNMSAFASEGAPDDPGYRKPLTHGTTFRYSGTGPLGHPRRAATIPPGAKAVASSGGWTIWQLCQTPAASPAR
jgi:hypothetical protein